MSMCKIYRKIAVILVETRIQAFMAIILSLKVVLNYCLCGRNDKKHKHYYSCQLVFDDPQLSIIFVGVKAFHR